jgi:V/A-type H+-transporting ATPase subunit D
MSRLRIAPTHSNLLHTREALKLAREGYEILDKKREVLTTELMHIAHDATALQERVWDLLAEAYRALETARLSMGRERLEWAALSVNETVEVEVRPHSVMGVVIPVVQAHVELDEAVARFRRVLAEIPALSETMTTVWRLARELQKTQRRVNALQYIFIPQYEETVDFIESALEEREREATFRLKRLKSRGERPTVGPSRREYEQPYRDIGGGKPTSREFG